MYGRAATFLANRLSLKGEAAQEETFSELVSRLRVLREKSSTAGGETLKTIAVDESTGNPAATLQLEKRTGCWICGAVLDAIFGFLSKYQYELTINPDTQREHAMRGGFCPLHTWQYENLSSPYGVCTAYPELAHRIAGELERLASKASDAGDSLEELKGLVASAKTCRVCEVRIEAEERAVNSAATTVSEASASGKMRLPACCLPHLVLIAATLGAGQPARNLLHAHGRLLERTAEDLQRYALRHDALRRYLTSEEERGASQLALLLLAGHRSVNAPWSVDSIL